MDTDTPVAISVYPELLRFAKRHYPQVGEDLAHDAWLILHKAELAGKLRDPQAVWGFLATTLHRLAMREWTKEHRRSDLYETSAVTDPR